MNYSLPTKLTVNTKEYEIRSDYRAILDICQALADVELSDEDKAYIVLTVFFVDFKRMPQCDYQEAIEKCFDFINLGEKEDGKKHPKMIDWEQDFNHIIAPINRVAQKEVRAVEYMHWWTFIGLFNEIGGDCYFAQIVSIRDKKRRGKKLDKLEQEFYRRNRKDIDFTQHFTDEEEDALKGWI